MIELYIKNRKEKKMKKLLIYVLTLVAAFVLVGCDGVKPEPEDPGENPENPGENPENPEILDYIAQLMAQNNLAEQSGPKLKTGQDAMLKPEPANPVPPAARTELEVEDAQDEE